jgi:predicted GNAT family acetyltransferase
MRVVKTSELFKMLTIPALGKYTDGMKMKTATERCFVKRNGKYKCISVSMNYTMVLQYQSNDWVVALGNSEDYNNIYLASIFVSNKGKGIGTDVMNTILDYCDENGYKLYLHPFPLDYTKEKFDMKKALPLFFKLRDWYKSFDMEEQEDGYMVYYPKNNLIDNQ